MKIRRLVYFLAILIIGILIVANLGQFATFLDTLSQANLLVLATILVARYLYYWSNAKYFMSTFKLFGAKIKFRRALETSVVYNFLNTVIPSGGVSGTSYVAREFHNDVKASVATAVQLAWYVFTFIGYSIVLVAGFVSLVLSNQVNKVSFKVVLLVMVLVIAGIVGVSVLATNFSLAKKVAWRVFRPVNWVLQKLKKRPVTQPKLNSFLEEFYHSFRLMLRERGKLWKPLWFSFLGVFAEILSIYIVFLSLGRIINPGIVITGYSLAMLSSFSAILTSGVGVYEAVMSATFVALGESFSTSFAVVIIYRFIAMWLFIPLGLYIYRKKHLDE